MLKVRLYERGTSAVKVPYQMLRVNLIVDFFSFPCRPIIFHDCPMLDNIDVIYFNVGVLFDNPNRLVIYYHVELLLICM